MSRAAVFDAICADPTLQGMGYHGETTPGANDGTVLAGYDGEQRPSHTMFMVIRWETESVILQGDDNFTRTEHPCVFWVHMYREFSTDYNRIRDTIDAIDKVLVNMIDVAGADGESVTMIIPGQRSRDLRDDGYQTLCRSAQYNVISRPT
jgi:hypothetical protein